MVGYQLAVRCRIPVRHSACTVLVTPVPNWEELDLMGRMINHSCCLKHVNCEYVFADGYDVTVAGCQRDASIEPCVFVLQTSMDSVDSHLTSVCSVDKLSMCANSLNGRFKIACIFHVND